MLEVITAQSPGASPTSAPSAAPACARGEAPGRYVNHPGPVTGRQRTLAACPADPPPTDRQRDLALRRAWSSWFWPGRCTFAELYWSTARKLAFRCLEDLIALGILSNRLSLKFL